jgi:hypothetical protein
MSTLDPAAWAKWLEYRSAGKWPIEPGSRSESLNKAMLSKLGTQQMAAVEHSIAMGWRGCFAPKPKPVEPTAPKVWETPSSDRLSVILQEFADLTGKHVTKPQIDVIRAGLQGMRPDELERAREGLLRTWQYPSIPKPADFWRAARSYGWL